jgi:hypothetical protein
MRVTDRTVRQRGESLSLHSPDERLADALFRKKHVPTGFYHR